MTISDPRAKQPIAQLDATASQRTGEPIKNGRSPSSEAKPQVLFDTDDRTDERVGPSLDV